MYNSFDCVILEQFEHPNLLIDQTYINAFAALKPGGTLLFHGYRPIDYFGLAHYDNALKEEMFSCNRFQASKYFVNGKLSNAGFDLSKSSRVLKKEKTITQELFYDLPILKEGTNNFKYDSGEDFYTPGSHDFYIKGIKPQ